MIEHATASDAKDFIVCTVVGILRELTRRNAGTDKRFRFPTTTPRCENMDLQNLQPVCAIRSPTRCTSTRASPPLHD